MNFKIPEKIKNLFAKKTPELDTNNNNKESLITKGIAI